MDIYCLKASRTRPRTKIAWQLYAVCSLSLSFRAFLFEFYCAWESVLTALFSVVVVALHKEQKAIFVSCLFHYFPRFNAPRRGQNEAQSEAAVIG